MRKLFTHAQDPVSCWTHAAGAAAALGGGLHSAPESDPSPNDGSVTLSGGEKDEVSNGSKGEETFLPKDETQHTGELLPNLSDNTSVQEEPAGNQDNDTGEKEPSAGETETNSAQTQPTTKPTQPATSVPETPTQVTPEPDPVPTKAELESQAETAAAESRYSDAAGLYRKMKELG